MSKTYVIDIDGTICDWQAGRDYTLAEPFPDRIKVINYLYDKGFLTTKKIQELVDWFEGPVFIDSKKTKLPKKGCFLKINEVESKILKGRYQNLIITKGAAGADYDGVNYPAEKTKIVDVVGAGDTFLAALVYFHLLYGKIEEAIPFANKAAAIAVQNFGTYVLTEEDVKNIRD